MLRCSSWRSPRTVRKQAPLVVSHTRIVSCSARPVVRHSKAQRPIPGPYAPAESAAAAAFCLPEPDRFVPAPSRNEPPVIRERHAPERGGVPPSEVVGCSHRKCAPAQRHAERNTVLIQEVQGVGRLANRRGVRQPTSTTFQVGNTSAADASTVCKLFLGQTGRHTVRAWRRRIRSSYPAHCSPISRADAGPGDFNARAEPARGAFIDCVLNAYSLPIADPTRESQH